MDEIDKLLEHVTANCDEIVDNIKQDDLKSNPLSVDEICDSFSKEVDELCDSFSKEVDELWDSFSKESDESEEEEDEKWLQNCYDTEGQSNADERLNFETMLEHIVNQMLDEAREIDDIILEMIADGEIELYRNEDNIVMMKLTELGHKKHEEDLQNGE